jgi:hypothetical protein
MKRWPWIVGGVVFIAIMFALSEGLQAVAEKWGLWPVLFLLPCIFAYALWCDWSEAKKRISALEAENESLRQLVQPGATGRSSPHRSEM